MSDIDFTPEEREALARFARDRFGVVSRFWFYASVLGPFGAFAIYGLIKGDVVALFVAFVGQFSFLAWRISVELANIEVYKSALRKVLDHHPPSTS